MYSFYGGKQGRTYNLVERYDQIYINQANLPGFNPNNTYHSGDRFTFEAKIYLVLPQDSSDITLTVADLKDGSKVAEIKGMVNEFQKGGAYTDANYGEYVIIDTILNENHRNDDINGLIYRRGFDYTEPVAAMERPKKQDKEDVEVSGRTYRVPVYYEWEIINEQVSVGNFLVDKWVAAWRKYILKPGGGAIYVGQIVGPQGDSPELVGIGWQEFLELEGATVLDPTESAPGIEKDEQTGEWRYNDNIKFGHCTIRDADGNITGAYIAFNIPHTVLKVSSQSVDPYGKWVRAHEDEVSGETDEGIGFTAIQAAEDSPIWKYEDLIHLHTKTGEEAGHPYYYNFDIAVPSGIHGQDVEEIKKETVEEINQKLDDGEKIEIDGENVFNGDQYISYYLKHYNNGAEGAISVPLGRWPYRVIREIFSNYKERTPFTNWGSAAKIGELSFLIPTQNVFAVCVQAGLTSEDGLEFNPSSYKLGDEIRCAESLWRVITLPQTAAAHTLEVDYTAGPNDIIEGFRVIDYIFMDDVGGLYVVYTDEDGSEPHFLTTIGSIKDVYFDEESGKLKIFYLDGRDYQFSMNVIEQVSLSDSTFRIRYYGGQTYQAQVKQLESIEYSNQGDITQTQKIIAKYQGLEDQDVSDAINTVLSISRLGDNVIVLYSDPDYRESIRQAGIKDKDYYELPFTDTKGRTYDSLVWKNLGPLGAQYHVQGTYTLNDLKPGGVLENGFTGQLADRAGWLVTINDAGVSSLYAYDYNEVHTWPDGTQTRWYKLKDLDAALTDPTLTVRLSPESLEEGTRIGFGYQEDHLNENGLWFVVTGGHDVQQG